MRIPLPCKFGETFGYKGKSLKLLSVSWFKWSYKGLEFTYTTDKEFSYTDRKSTRLNSSHPTTSRMPSSA